MGSIEFGSTASTVVPAVRLGELSLLEPTNEELALIESSDDYDPVTAMAGLKYRTGLQAAMTNPDYFEVSIDISPTPNQLIWTQLIGDASLAAAEVEVVQIRNDATPPVTVAPRAPAKFLEENWQEDANCLGVDPELFFPERGASLREAKAVCRGCVALNSCLEFALSNGEKFGVWGGTSERERRAIRRQRALAAGQSRQVSV